MANEQAYFVDSVEATSAEKDYGSVLTTVRIRTVRHIARGGELPISSERG